MKSNKKSKIIPKGETSSYTPGKGDQLANKMEKKAYVLILLFSKAFIWRCATE